MVAHLAHEAERWEHAEEVALAKQERQRAKEVCVLSVCVFMQRCAGVVWVNAHVRAWDERGLSGWAVRVRW